MAQLFPSSLQRLVREVVPVSGGLGMLVTRGSPLLAAHGGRCSACRSLAPVRKDDPRMARLLDEHPLLDRWPRWRIAETKEQGDINIAKLPQLVDVPVQPGRELTLELRRK